MATSNKKKVSDYGSAPVYNQSSSVNQAASDLAAMESNRPGSYNSKYQASIDSTLNNILNKQDFKYDMNNDALYNQYKDYYTQAGKTAMQDTIGQATALTGGYGSSYAQTAGQQQYNAYMQQLAQIVPQLEERAYNRYRDSIADNYNTLSMLQSLDDSSYGRYRDTVGDWRDDLNYLYGKYADERNFDYSKYQTALDQFNTDRNFAYGYDRDAISDSQWQQNYNESVRQYNASLAEQQRQFDAQQAAAAAAAAKGPELSLSEQDSIVKTVRAYNGQPNATMQRDDGETVLGGWKYLTSLVETGTISMDQAYALYDLAVSRTSEDDAAHEAWLEELKKNARGQRGVNE